MILIAVAAQLVLGASAGVVRYDQQSTTGSLVLAPEIRLERPRFMFDAAGGYTAGSDGGRIGEATGTIWGATRPFSGGYQLDGLVQASTTQPQADSSSQELFVLGELAWSLADRGVGVGLGTVQAGIQGTPAVSAFRAELRGWYVLADSALTLTGSIEPTQLQGSWFTELAGGAEWTPGSWDVSAGLRLRAVSGAGLSLGGESSVSRDINAQWAVELDAGRYLRDPFQGLPAGYYVSLGVRLKLASWRSASSEGVGAMELGDLSMKAARGAFGMRTVSSLPAPSGGNSGRGSGNGHRPF